MKVRSIASPGSRLHLPTHVANPEAVAAEIQQLLADSFHVEQVGFDAPLGAPPTWGLTDFIAKNMSTMSELALYKMAALVYKTKVADPAEEEGVDGADTKNKEKGACHVVPL